MRILYQAPEDQVIRRYARTVSEALAERHTNPAIRRDEVVDGLARCLCIVAQVTALQINEDTNE